VLAISVLSEWIQAAVSYLPAFAAGLVVTVLGFVVADLIGDAQARAENFGRWWPRRRLILVAVSS